MNARGEPGSLKLPRTHRLTLYAIAVGVWVTGALWLIYHYFLRTQGPFGFRNNPLESVWLELHGGFSFASIWIFGVLWATHIVRGWTINWRRWSGGFMVGCVVFLILTGYGLYYIGSRNWREWTSVAHWVVGLVALALFLIHWLSKSLPRRVRDNP